MGKVSGQTPENTPETGPILFLHSGKPTPCFSCKDKLEV